MKIIVGEDVIQLPDKEVHSCRRVAGEFLNNVRNEAQKKGYYTYYFTFIFTMWLITQQMITDMDMDFMKEIMERLGGKKPGPLSFPDAMVAFDEAVRQINEALNVTSDPDDTQDTMENVEN